MKSTRTWLGSLLKYLSWCYVISDTSATCSDVTNKMPCIKTLFFQTKISEHTGLQRNIKILMIQKMSKVILSSSKVQP